MTTSDKMPPLDFKAMAAHQSRRDHGAVPVHVTFCGDEDPCESPLDDKRIDCRITPSVAADLAYYVRMMPTHIQELLEAAGASRQAAVTHRPPVPTGIRKTGRKPTDTTGRR